MGGWGRGAGWLSRFEVRFLVSPQVVISGGVRLSPETGPTLNRESALRVSPYLCVHMCLLSLSLSNK